MPTNYFKPKKSLGQNFLKNPRIVGKIIETANLIGDEIVIEVGPGFGILTEELLKHAKKVIAIEKDAELFEFLREKFKNQIDSEKLELIHGDALKIPPPKEPYAWIANIPYSITSPLLDHFIRENPENLPKRAVLLVQKEVAQKLCAAPPRMNVLALHVQTFGDPKIVADVSRANFKPAPKVDSAIIKIDFPKMPKISALKTKADYEKYFSLIHKTFSQKRKMLRRTLPQELLKKAGITETRRPETLSVKEWIDLTNFAKYIYNSGNMEKRTEALIVDDEEKIREEVTAAIKEVFTELNIQQFPDRQTIEQAIHDIGDTVFLVISDGVIERADDGESVVYTAKKKGIPNIAYYSGSADSIAWLMEPDGIKCIKKSNPWDKPLTPKDLLKNWLQSIKTH